MGPTRPDRALSVTHVVYDITAVGSGVWDALRRPYLVWCWGPVTGAVETLRELREKPQGGRKTLDIPTYELWGSAAHPDPAP